MLAAECADGHACARGGRTRIARIVEPAHKAARIIVGIARPIEESALIDEAGRLPGQDDLISRAVQAAADHEVPRRPRRARQRGKGDATCCAAAKGGLHRPRARAECKCPAESLRAARSGLQIVESAAAVESERPAGDAAGAGDRIQRQRAALDRGGTGVSICPAQREIPRAAFRQRDRSRTAVADNSADQCISRTGDDERFRARRARAAAGDGPGKG